MNHETEQALGAYALGALEADERQQVEGHLDGCLSCQALLASYESVTEALLYVPQSEATPRTVRSRLLRRLVGPDRASSWLSRLRAVPAARVGLAAGVILLVGVNIGYLVQTQRLLAQGQNVMAQQQAGQAALAIGSYPSSQVAVIEEDGIRGTFVYEPDLPVAVMYVWGLQPPGEDRSYQAWLVDAEGERMSGGLLSFNADEGYGWLMIRAAAPMLDFRSVGVTLEPAGGSPAPTGPRILGTDL